MKIPGKVAVAALTLSGVCAMAHAAEKAVGASALPATVRGGMASAAPSNRATQGYLGIDVRDVSEDSLNTLRLREARGAEIIRVDHDGPAGKMGLREHDVVLQMNGMAVEGQEPLRRMLHDSPPGRTITLVISRDGQQSTVSAQMADKAEVERQAYEQHLGGNDPQAPALALPAGEPGGDFTGVRGNAATMPASRYSKSFLGTLLMSPSYTGVTLDIVGPQLADFFGVQGGGLLVRSVAVNSPAAMAGMRAGDIVTKTNARPVGNPSHWAKTVREAKGRPITVTIMRDRQEKTLTLLPDSKKRSCLNLPFEHSQAHEDVYVVARRNPLEL